MEELFRQACKNCGAEFVESDAVNGVIKCRYCHSAFTIPKKETNPAALSFLRQGEHDLDTCRFDDAYTAYEKAASFDSSEPEAYFGMALAEFKVQYIKDTVNNCLQPVCHEITDKVFSESKNFKRTLELATSNQRIEYERKGCDIDDIGREFYKLKQSGLDYDCFICVKVTDDETKMRTADYKDADDIYFELRGKGYKPFFSERELRGVAGADYEARILYALYRSSCMLVVCSNEEYLRTPWVKNEYTRFLKLVNDEEKESDSITIVYGGKPIERLVGKSGKIQGVDIRSLSAMDRIVGFVERHSASGKARAEEEAIRRREEEERKRKQEEANERRIRELEERLKNISATTPAPASQPARVLESKFCAYCGEEVVAEAVRCPTCGGNKFKTKAEAERDEREAKLRAQQEAIEAKRRAEEYAARKAKEEAEKAQKEWEKKFAPTIDNYDTNLFEINGTTLIKCKDEKAEDVIIPRGITVIGKEAFKICKALKSLKIPDGVTEIGEAAFNGCWNLANIVIPESVTVIGKDAFSSCYGLTKIDIPNSVKIIGDNAFTCCNFTNITIPESVTKISGAAFSICKKLSSVAIPKSVTEIGGIAFLMCENLREIYIPASVQTVGSMAFLDCKNLKEIHCEAATQPAGWDKEWAKKKGGFLSKDHKVIWGYKKP